MIEGLRGVRLLVPDLAIGKAWYARALQVEPYLGSDNSATFFVNGTLLTLDQGQPSAEDGTVAYWAVDDLAGEYQRLVDIGSAQYFSLRAIDAVTRTAAVLDPFGNVFGIVERKDPAAIRARTQRVAEKVAIRNVREVLDDLSRAEQSKRGVFRFILVAAALGITLAAVLLWDVSGGRPFGGGIQTFQSDTGPRR